MAHILIVEDDPDGADLIWRMFRATGKPAAVAGNAETALAVLRANPADYAAVVIDLALPEMDGFELMSLIRADATLEHLPLIAITAFHTPELKVRALDSGFTAYFAKPLDTTLFVRAIDRLLEGGG